MSETTTITINEAIDQAIAIMPNSRKKRRLEERLENDRYRARFSEKLMDAFEDDRRIKSMGVLPSLLGAEGFTADTPFAIDTNKLRELFDVILEYAPKFLDLVLTIISLFGAILLALVLPSVATASSPLSLNPVALAEIIHNESATQIQEIPKGILAQFDCPNGICPLPAPVVASAETVPTLEVIPVSSTTYTRQWFNHDGLTARQHSEIYHKRSTAGLTDVQVIANNDHDHNTWGSGHHPVARVAGAPIRFVANQQPVRSTVRYVAETQPVRSAGRRVIRGATRAIAAIRPRNIAARVRSRAASRRCR